MTPPSTQPVSVRRLREVHFLRDLGAEVLEELRPHVTTRTFQAGEPILRAGDYFDGAYVLVSGQVEARLPVLAEQPAVRGVRAVAGVSSPLSLGQATVLEAGEIFGEGSALSRYPIGYNLTALTDVNCLVIRTQGLRAMFDVPEMESFKALFDQIYRERTLIAHLRAVDIFAGLRPASLAALRERAELVTFKPGARIATEGEACEAFYLVRGGSVQASVKTHATDTSITYLRVGEWFGEATLLVDVPWPYSLTAIDNVELVKLSQEDLRAIVPHLPEDQRLWDVMVDRLGTRGRTVEDPSTSRPLQMSIESGVIRGESVLLIDLNTCTKCDECVRACADTHQGVPRFVREGSRFDRFSVPTACYHCSDPVCMVGCPTGAITRPLGTFKVAIDSATCIGCGNCVQRCPWNNILTRPVERPDLGKVIEVATKCDLCLGRSEGPACVQMCPQGSAQRVDFKDAVRVAKLLST
ncbi:MAG: cyclic nucleotide-binding domain-containing protein [Vicinamibacteria bacterium]|nr:cyclic nucleotide-binding domain-containing protein [Vicinamibacteria bacterium]